jgi:arylsulfatase A-like enzyme
MMKNKTRLNFLISVVALAAVLSASAAKQPNILFIFTDDQRYDSIGYENSEIQTPHLDRLAKGGVIFNNCFVNTSICAVSRANIMTGQYPMRHGVTDFYKTLDRDQLAQTYPAILKRAGYYTGIVGKWGIGHTVENTYTALPAFDFWAGASHQTLFWHDRDCNYVTKNGAENICTCGKAINKDGVGPGGHQSSYKHLQHPLHTDTDIFPMKVEQFLSARDPDKPFCLSLFYKAPHGPNDGWDRFKFADTYKGTSFTLPETATLELADARPEFLRSEQTMLGVKGGYEYLRNPAKLQAYVRDYNRLIVGMDYSVGKVLEILEENGLLEDTVILFTSDNGHFNADHGFLGKWLMREPSLRVPGFVVDPRLPANLRGRRIDPMVTTIDYTATILGLAGVDVPEAMQGHSFLPLVRDEQPAAPWQTEFFYDHPYGHGGKLPLIHGVRTDRYKYTRYISEDPPFEELFDLENDSNEIHNLADSPEHRTLLNQLRKKTDQSVESMN